MSIEIKKIELSKKRVELGIDELEFKIIERLDDIERLKQNIIISKEKVEEIQEKINNLKGV